LGCRDALTGRVAIYLPSSGWAGGQAPLVRARQCVCACACVLFDFARYRFRARRIPVCPCYYYIILLPICILYYYVYRVTALHRNNIITIDIIIIIVNRMLLWCRMMRSIGVCSSNIVIKRAKLTSGFWYIAYFPDDL